MKTIIKIIVGLVTVLAMVSCAGGYIDIMVDKSQLKRETETHAFYPAEAVTPVVNPDAVAEASLEITNKAQEKLNGVILTNVEKNGK